ncbi:MAG TPA: GNAT family N-acetyltransferase [Devosia sp.]
MRIETERLTLDLHGVEDFDDFAAMWLDPETVRFIGGKVGTRQDCWTRLLRYRGLWPLLGYGYWAVHEKASGRFAGDIGFADFHRATDPSIEGIPEAGWVLASWARGKGYAHEALTAACAWLDRQGFAESVCIIDPANTPSLRLADRLGYGAPRPLKIGEETITLFTRPRA